MTPNSLRPSFLQPLLAAVQSRCPKFPPAPARCGVPPQSAPRAALGHPCWMPSPATPLFSSAPPLFVAESCRTARPCSMLKTSCQHSPGDARPRRGRPPGPARGNSSAPGGGRGRSLGGLCRCFFCPVSLYASWPVGLQEFMLF